jgi:hypothetical protein
MELISQSWDNFQVVAWFPHSKSKKNVMVVIPSDTDKSNRVKVGDFIVGYINV